MSESPVSQFKRQLALEEISQHHYFESIHWVDSIDSTNKQLSESVRNGQIRLPALLVADEQTAGVGRGNHRWWSPVGCLMFSMAIPMPTLLTETDLLPLRVGCTIARSVEPLLLERPMVKWPNDVYLFGKKICGILIDVVPAKAESKWVAIIGIGINCQVDFREAPQELQRTATSLHQWLKAGKTEIASRESVLVQFIQEWLHTADLQAKGEDWLFEDWRLRSLLDGCWVEVKHAQGISQGKCLGISRRGALLIQDEQLRVTEVLAGTVQSFRSLAD